MSTMIATGTAGDAMKDEFGKALYKNRRAVSMKLLNGPYFYYTVYTNASLFCVHVVFLFLFSFEVFGILAN